MASPDPTDAASLVHEGWDQLRLQRPLAAWAKWRTALRIDPGLQAAEEALAILADAAELPLAARLTYKFRSPTDDAARLRWSSAFSGRDLQDLDVAAEAFAEVAEGDPSALHNLGLCLAWSGRNAEAIAALDASVTAGAEAAFDAAVESWTIAEILRQGAGAEPLADDWTHALMIAWDDAADGDPLEALSAVAAVRTVPVPPDPASGAPPIANARVLEVLDRPIPARWEEIAGPLAIPRVQATVIALPGLLRFSGPDREALAIVEARLRGRIGDRPGDRTSTPLPLRLMDADVWLARLPGPAPSLSPEANALGLADLRRGAVEAYYENHWIARPRTALAGSEDVPLSPVEAARLARAGDAAMRAKLAAVVSVREQLALRPHLADLYQGYPFDRLRRRLGLDVRDAGTIDERDISSMGEAELEALDPSALDAPDVPEAELAARSVCRPEVHARFLAEAERRAAP